MINSKSKSYNVFLALFLFAGSLVGFLFSINDVYLFFTGIRTEGVVSDAYCVTTCRSRIVNVSYTDKSGSSHVLTLINSLSAGLYKKGDKVSVYYNKDKPALAVDFSLWIFIFPFLMLILLGFFVLVLKSFWSRR